MTSGSELRPNVCILGLGLIGGSLLRALSDRIDIGRKVYGYNRSEATVDAARADGYVASTDLSATLQRASADDALIVIATPATTVDTIARAIAEHAPDCAITDVVSVKQHVAQILSAHGLTDRYVGGHPMAGTAQSGWAATDPTLFGGAIWVVATDDGADPDVWKAVATMATDVNAVVVPAATDDHDRAVAAISHLPHLTAAATAAVGAAQGELALRLAAGSFRDGTRVAGSPPELQRAMLETNADALLSTLSEAIDLLTEARDSLRTDGSVRALVNAGHRGRQHYEQLAAARTPMPPVTVGAPGWESELRRHGQLGQVCSDLD